MITLEQRSKAQVGESVNRKTITTVLKDKKGSVKRKSLELFKVYHKPHGGHSQNVEDTLLRLDQNSPVWPSCQMLCGKEN